MTTSWHVPVRWCTGFAWIIGVIGLNVGLIRYYQFMAPLTTSYYDHNIFLYFSEHVLFLLLLVISSVSYHPRWRLGWIIVAGVAGLLLLAGFESHRPIERFRMMLNISPIPQPFDNAWALHYQRSTDGPWWVIGGSIGILLASTLYLGVGTYAPKQRPRAGRWTWIIWLLAAIAIAVGIVVFAWFDTTLAQLHVDASFIEAGFWTHIQVITMGSLFCAILGISALIWWNKARSWALPALWSFAVALLLVAMTTRGPLETYQQMQSKQTTPIPLRRSISMTAPVYDHARWLVMTGAWGMILLGTGWRLHDAWRYRRVQAHLETIDEIPPSPLA